MEALLSTYDFSGVHAKYVDDMKDACRRFQEFKLNPEDPPITVECSNGSTLDYIISPAKNGINVHAFYAGTSGHGSFVFGVMITRDGDDRDDLGVWPYMNGHRD